MSNTDRVIAYVQEIKKYKSTGEATEHTYRPALRDLLQSLGQKVTAINEPKRVECGAPDFVVARGTGHGLLTIGYVEAKDVDVRLHDIERDSKRATPTTRSGQQLKRYLAALPNLVLTNHLEFRWYVDGKRRQIAELATLTDGKVHLVDGGIDAVVALLGDFLDRSVLLMVYSSSREAQAMGRRSKP